MRLVQIKENKDSYYAVDTWLDKYDSGADYIRMLNENTGLRNTSCPDPLFRRLNWNQMNYETLSMMKMYVEFHDVNLEMIFLMAMSDHVEKIYNPYEALGAGQKIEEESYEIF